MTTWSPEVNNGITTTWLPFTSSGVSAAPSCATQMYLSPGTQEILALDVWQDKIIPYQPQCHPAEVTQSVLQTSASGSSVTTELGPMHCPSLYTTASTIIVSQTSTSVICCPSQFSLQGSQCLSEQTTGSVVPQSLVVNSAGVWVSWTPVTITSTAMITGGPVVGYILGTASATGTSTSNSSPLATSTPLASNNKSGNSNGGLSSGAIAGVAIGAMVIGIVLGAAITMFVLARRRRKSAVERHELSGVYTASTEKNPETFGQVHELPQETSLYEVGTPPYG